MKCRDLIVYFSDYVDGELDQTTRTIIDSHGCECPPCRAFLKTLHRTVEVVRASPRYPLSPALREALCDALRKAR